MTSPAPGSPTGLSLLHDPALEERLAAAIEPWLTHMCWRKDFEAWRKRRVWQENYQDDVLRDIRRALRGQIAGKRLLDLGSGMGGLSVALLRAHGSEGIRLQSLDYNLDYCRIALLRAERYGQRLNIAVAAGEALPYPARSFDLIVCMDVLEHVADPYQVLSEMFRVLGPGGVVLTTVPNRHAFRDPHFHLPLINWLPMPAAEWIIGRAGRSKHDSALHDRQSLSDLHTYTWAGFARLARSVGFGIRDQVRRRVLRGDIRQLGGWRRKALDLLIKARVAGPLYSLYRYGWQGTYQIMLIKPGSDSTLVS